MSESPSDNIARRYRAKAERLHEQAAQMRWSDLREQLDKIAREYELLADSAERYRAKIEKLNRGRV